MPIWAGSRHCIRSDVRRASAMTAERPSRTPAKNAQGLEWRNVGPSHREGAWWMPGGLTSREEEYSPDQLTLRASVGVTEARYYGENHCGGVGTHKGKTYPGGEGNITYDK